MNPAVRVFLTLALWVLPACAGDAQQAPPLVRSSDPELRELAAALLPDLARRSGLELKGPVRLERRTRAELERYLRHKLDERLPESEARRTVAAYALLGLVPDTLDLRALMMGLYTEQVAGFYEPDSVALFILDDQPAAVLQPLLVHELVHAVQDQSVDLRALTDPNLGNDRATAAQAAIEGHATLVMLEYLSEQMRGAPVDLARVQDFAGTLRPALEGMQGQFPALSGAPAVVRQTLFFGYVEGAGFVQDLWSKGGRTAPFGAHLPLSTEQVLTRDLTDAPVRLSLAVEGGRSVHEDDLGRLEAGVFLETHVGAGQARLADGWGGDRYALVELPGGGQGLAWVVVWDGAYARDRWVAAVDGSLGRLPSPATVEALEVGGRPASLLRVGLGSGVRVRAEIRP
jgi:hypothetical protein